VQRGCSEGERGVAVEGGFKGLNEKITVLSASLIIIAILVSGCAFWVADSTVRNAIQENAQVFFYVRVLEDSGVNVTFVLSLQNVDNLNATLNPIKLPTDYGITGIATCPLMEYFIKAVYADNITTVYFSWQSSNQWTFAYLKLFPEYHGAKISSCSSGGNP
jgi:hypothetical protein